MPPPKPSTRSDLRPTLSDRTNEIPSSTRGCQEKDVDTGSTRSLARNAPVNNPFERALLRTASQLDGVSSLQEPPLAHEAISSTSFPQGSSTRHEVYASSQDCRSSTSAGNSRTSAPPAPSPASRSHAGAATHQLVSRSFSTVAKPSITSQASSSVAPARASPLNSVPSHTGRPKHTKRQRVDAHSCPGHVSACSLPPSGVSAPSLPPRPHHDRPLDVTSLSPRARNLQRLFRLCHKGSSILYPGIAPWPLNGQPPAPQGDVILKSSHQEALVVGFICSSERLLTSGSRGWEVVREGIENYHARDSASFTHHLDRLWNVDLDFGSDVIHSGLQVFYLEDPSFSSVEHLAETVGFLEYLGAHEANFYALAPGFERWVRRKDALRFSVIAVEKNWNTTLKHIALGALLNTVSSYADLQARLTFCTPQLQHDVLAELRTVRDDRQSRIVALLAVTRVSGQRTVVDDLVFGWYSFADARDSCFAGCRPCIETSRGSIVFADGRHDTPGWSTPIFSSLVLSFSHGWPTTRTFASWFSRDLPGQLDRVSRDMCVDCVRRVKADLYTFGDALLVEIRKIQSFAAA